MTRTIRTASTTLAAAALLLGSATAALANQPGLADGWFDPAGATAVIAAADVVAAPAATCSGYEVGLPDGCWSEEGTIVAAGRVTSADAELVPDNVR